MGAEFSSKYGIADPHNMREPFSRLEYSDSSHARWLNGIQKPRIEAKEAPEIGLRMPKGHDINYWLPSFGNITAASMNGDVKVPINLVGKYISKAYNTEILVKEFMDPDAFSDSKLGSIYYRLRDYLDEYKGTKFEITDFGAGLIPATAIAGVRVWPNGRVEFYTSKDYENSREGKVNNFKIDTQISDLSTLIHEFLHIFGIRGQGVESEAKVEAATSAFMDELIKEVQGASTYSDAERTRIIRTLRQIKKIADIRYQRAEEFWSGYYETEALYARVIKNNKNQKYSESELESIVSDLIDEAAEEGIEPDRIEAYVNRRLEERLYKENKAVDEAEAAGKEEEAEEYSTDYDPLETDEEAADDANETDESGDNPEAATTTDSSGESSE